MRARYNGYDENSNVVGDNVTAVRSRWLFSSNRYRLVPTSVRVRVRTKSCTGNFVLCGETSVVVVLHVQSVYD